MSSTCNFELDRSNSIYYSGETINGRIELTTTKEKTVRDVYILFEGEAKVKWSESRSRSSVTYYNEQKLFHSRTSVFSEGTLPPGTHIYTFKIALSDECPSSCDEKYGDIKYELILVINRVLHFDNVFTQPITVIKPLNLNLQSQLMLPLRKEAVKFFCFWLCTSEPVLSALSIPFGGYVPGQNIKYKLEIENKSGYDLKDGVELRLEQTYTFLSKKPEVKTRTLTKLLAKSMDAMSCLRLTKRAIEGSLVIPPAPPSITDGIIQLSYSIKIIIIENSCHSDSEITIPITIGTIALSQTVIDTTASGSTDPPVGYMSRSYDQYNDSSGPQQKLRSTEPPARQDNEEPLIRQQGPEQTKSTSFTWNS